MRRRTFLTAAAAMTAVPAGAGTSLYVPPEEAPHERTLMQWPVSRKVHPDQSFLESVQQTIADIANAIVEFEPVAMLMDAAHKANARQFLSDAVEIWEIETEDLWCRDSGPLFARKGAGELVVSHIRFNGWGRKQIHKADGQIARKVAERLGLEIVDSGLVGEAGGVEHDGHGLLMAHESSWVIGNRNPGLTRTQIADRLMAAYGAKQILWAPGVRDRDITDYHIDSLARFTSPARVLMNLPDDPEPGDPFHQAALTTHDRIEAKGWHVDVIPEPVELRTDQHDFVASYVNFYVCNGAVILPEFGDPETDPIAVDALSRHFPGREMIALDTDPLGMIGGGIHCATQQMPKL